MKGKREKEREKGGRKRESEVETRRERGEKEGGRKRKTEKERERGRARGTERKREIGRERDREAERVKANQFKSAVLKESCKYLLCNTLQNCTMLIIILVY